MNSNATGCRRTRQRMRLGLVLAMWVCMACIVVAQTRSAGFDGRWDLTVHDPRGDFPSWLEIGTRGASVHVLFVGRIGHAREVKDASLADGVLRFSVPAEGLADATQTYEARVGGGERGVPRRLAGTLQEAGHSQRSWSGVPAPLLARHAEMRWGTPVSIFDGKTLNGWHASDGHGGNWSVHDGLLIASGRGADLISDAKFQDLQLHLEWRCSEGANSGVYLRGRYEVQIETDSAKESASHHTGGVYGFLAPKPEQPRRANIWHSFDVTLVGRTVTVVQDGVTVIDRKQIPGITGGALDSHEGAPGPVILQGGETGRIEFRNLRVRQPATD